MTWLLLPELRERALAFYARFFGPPQNPDDGQVQRGWHLGNTWLTIFPAPIGTRPGQNPSNTEFAVPA